MGFLEKEQKLPPAVKNLFSSEKPYVEVQKTCFMYGADPDKSSPLADVVGLIFVGDVALSDLPKKIAEGMSSAQDVTYGIAHHIGKSLFQPLREHFKDAEKLVSEWQQLKSAGLMSEDQAMQKVLERDSWILEIGKTELEEIEEKKPLVTTANMPLLQALSKYENLGNQLITGERIRIKSQPDPVRPSLLYWLKYYRDELGVGHHDNVQRGGFLFRSENGKKLSAAERERINLILKSVEENFPLAIDAERQEIVFPAFQGVLMGERPPRLGEAGREPSLSLHNAPNVKNDAAAPSWRGVSGELHIGHDVPPSVSIERAPRSAEIGSVNFSTAHIFPAEREAAEHRTLSPKPVPQVMPPPAPRPAPQPTFQPAPNPTPAPPFVPPPAPKITTPDPNPFYIHPVSLGGKEQGG